MNNSAMAGQPPEAIIRWPCDGLPYAATVRRRYFARLPTRYRVGTVYALLVLFICALAAQGHLSERPYAASPLLAWVLVAAFAWSIGVFFRYRAMKTVWTVLGNDPEGATEGWRAGWRRFEAESSALKTALPRLSLSLPAEQVWETAPRCPDVTCLLFEPESARNERPSRAATMSFAVPVAGAPPGAETIRGQVLLALASVGGRSVVGRAGNSVITTFMASESVPTQYWVGVTVTPTGSGFAIAVDTGIMWWAESGTRRTDGSTLVGDVKLYGLPVLLRHLRRSPAQILAWIPIGFFAAFAWGIAAPIALLAYLYIAYDAWKRPGEELQLRAGTSPLAGDSLDLALLSLDRERGELETIRPQDAVLDQVTALNQEVLMKVNAAARQVSRPLGAGIHGD